jgi:hypothetical protein
MKIIKGVTTWITTALVGMNLSITASRTQPACTSSSTRFSRGVECSALSPRPVASFHRDYTEADQALFRFLRATIQSPGENDIVILAQPFDYHDLVWRMAKTSHGGFLLVEIGEYLGFSNHLKRNRWELMPFHWREFWMYRKPMNHRMEASA